MFNFKLFGQKEEPAEDFDADYDEVYYGDVDLNDNNKATGDVDGIIDDGIVTEVNDVEDEEEPVAEVHYKRTFYPESYVESRDVVEAFMLSRVVIINIENLPKADFLRMFDYVMGAIQAIGGDMQKIDKNTVVLIPDNIDDVDIDELDEEPLYDEEDDYEENYYSDDDEDEKEEDDIFDEDEDDI